MTTLSKIYKLRLIKFYAVKHTTEHLRLPVESDRYVEDDINVVLTLKEPYFELNIDLEAEELFAFDVGSTYIDGRNNKYHAINSNVLTVGITLESSVSYFAEQEIELVCLHNSYSEGTISPLSSLNKE